MNGFIRAGLAGAGGAWLAKKFGPEVTKMLQPESDFAKTAVEVGVVGGSTAVAWFALGMLPGVK